MNEIKSYININNRSEIEIKGVKDIISCDCEKIIFNFGESELIFTGNNFNVKKLDLDSQSALITGYLYSLSFSDVSTKISKPFLKSLFK